MGRLSSRVVSPLDLQAEEIARWRSLCLKVPDLRTPFLSPEFVRSVAEFYPRVYVAVILRSGVPAGFFPYQFSDGYRRILRAAHAVGGSLSEDFGLVAEPGLELGERTLLKLSGLNYAGFTSLGAEQARYGLHGGNPETRLLVRLDGESEPYWENLKKRDRKWVARIDNQQAKLEAEHGPLRFCFQQPEIEPHLSLLIDAKRRQYARTGSIDYFADERYRRLVERLAALGEESCSGVLSTFHAGNTWVASHFGLRAGNMLAQVFPVYNPELSGYGPGLMLHKMMCLSAPGAGISLVDFGGGHYPYKQRFSNHTRLCYSGSWWRPGPRSLAYRAMRAIQWRLAAASRE